MPSIAAVSSCFGKPLRQPLERAHMRLRERRLVNAGLVGADATERMEIRKDPGAVDVQAIVRHASLHKPSAAGCRQSYSNRETEQSLQPGKW